MKKRKVLSRKQLPSAFPITKTAVAFLLLERFHASELVWGIVGTCFVIFWAAAIWLIATEEEITIKD